MPELIGSYPLRIPTEAEQQTPDRLGLLALKTAFVERQLTALHHQLDTTTERSCHAANRTTAHRSWTHWQPVATEAHTGVAAESH